MHLSPGRIARLLLVTTLLATLITARREPPTALAATSATTFFLLTSDNRIAALTDALPSQPTTPTAIAGIAAGDTLVDIDVRPQNGLLYGLGINAAADTGTLYLISPLASTATAIGAAGQITFGGVDFPDPATAGYGFDFNPMVDRARVVTSTGLNFRINPNDGVPIGPDGSINGFTTTVDGAAYTNNAPNVDTTTLYTLDSVTNSLYIQNPANNGTQTAPLEVKQNGTLLDFAVSRGFDIPPGVNAATSNAAAIGAGFAMLMVGGAQGLYQIELSTGAATLLGTLGTMTLRGLAVWSPLPIGNALSADGGSLLRFQFDDLATPASVTIANITAGETLVGIDSRPATGQLYGLGINAATNTGTLYLIDPQTGAATAVGTAGQITFGSVDFPNPATAGYGFDFNPMVDRARVVTSTGLNFRINPNDGVPIGPDSSINGLPVGSTGVAAAAYTNNYAGAIATTLYTIDPTSDRLFIQNPANNGTQTHGLPLTLNGAPLNATATNGFDIPPGASVTTSGTLAGGNAYAALTVGGVAGLYRIDLATGAATTLGTIGSGVPISGFVAWSETPKAQLTGTATVSEDAGTVKLTVRSTGGAPLLAGYRVGNSIATPGDDYTPISGMLMLGGSKGSHVLSLPIVDDAETEFDETLDVQLLGADGVAQALTLTILDNDPMVEFDSPEYNGSEVSGTAHLTVILEQTSPTTATVKYATVDDTAIAGRDYTAISGTLTFAPGETSKALSVPILGDLQIDAGETFTVTLRDPVGAVLCTVIDARVTIADDKPPHKLYLPAIRR